MGECAYYLKARFDTTENAQAAETVVRALCESLAKFHDAWQAMREDTNRTCAERRTALKAQFPLVADMVDHTPCGSVTGAWKHDDTMMNCLAVNIPDMTEDFELSIGGRLLLLMCDDVWHGTNWEGLAESCRKLPGCLRVGWVSEEDVPLTSGFDYCN